MTVYHAESTPANYDCSVNSNSNTHRDDRQHGVSLCVSQQDVDEGNDLQCLAKSHAVC